MALPLMPKATAVWLVENTALSFEQIADFCGMHSLEVQAIADGEVAIGIVGQGCLPACGQVIVNLQQRFFKMPRLLLAGGVVELEGNARALGQTAHRLDKREVLVLLDELENVAALVAAETVEDLALLIDIEARGLFAVERAQGGPIGPVALQGHVRANDLDNLAGGADLLKGSGRKQAGHRQLLADDAL